MKIKATACEPVGYQVLVADEETEEVINLPGGGSLIKPDSTIESEEHAQVLGRVVALGSLAFSMGNPRVPSEFHRMEEAPKVGDRVAFMKYAGGGHWFSTDKHDKCRILQDADIKAVVERAS